MVRRFITWRAAIAWAAIALAIGLAGCWSWFGYQTYHAAGGGNEAAIGEEHDVNYSAHDAFELTQDALRAGGVLYEIGPEENTLATLWKPADKSAGVLSSAIGIEPRYRYEIQVASEGSAKSKIVVNLRVEDIPDDQLDRYKASTRLDLFNKIDQLAAKFPPTPKTPTVGGVNFALLPNEDLKGLAKRVTGNASNWQQIAKDNGIKSPSDTSAFQTIWVSNTLLKEPAGSAQTR